MPEYTSDTLFNGSLRVYQERKGYRFSVDAVILAGHVRPRPGERVIELGTGCGIVLLILAFRYPRSHYLGIEVQPRLHDLGLRNVADNRMQDRIQLFLTDLKTLSPQGIGGRVDAVICNPPYRKAESGRLNPNPQKAIARHEMEMTLGQLLSAANRMLRSAGKFTIVYTADRLGELLLEMKKTAIEPKYLRVVHASRRSDAKMVLVEGIKDARRGFKIGPPLVMVDEAGCYTAEMARMFEADFKFPDH